MRCTNVGLLLGEYADGYADERSRRIVEHHIQRCRTCHNTVLITHQFGQQLLRLPLLPAGVLDRVPSIRRRLEYQLARHSRFRSRPVAIRAAYILIVLGVYALLWFLINQLIVLS